MKLIDQYIFKTYLRTLLTAFCILMLIFLLQSVWMYITELAGKDLELDIILKFLSYVSPKLVILVLPLAILLSSIMVFGQLSENYEFAAMKSTGLSLQRIMRSLIYFTLFLGIIVFFFSNNVVTAAEFNFINLRKNISKIKPTMAITEGQFSEIGDFNIKVEEKYGNRGQYLTDVIVHQKKNTSGNYTVIKSETGEITSESDSDILQLKLYDGNYYDEVINKDYRVSKSKPFVKSYFKEYMLNIDLSLINDVDFNQEGSANRYSMLNVEDLNTTIDSLVSKKKKDYQVIATKMHNRSNAKSLNNNINPIEDEFKGENVYDLFKPQTQKQLFDLGISSVNSTISILKSNMLIQARREKNINKHFMSLHDKFALSFACIILFFIGAPLGTIIRKGGYGFPMVISLILFLTYHFVGVFAKNLAEDTSISPILASWLSTIIMLPISVYLTNRATKDRSILNISEITGKFLQYFKK
ncbi:MAG: LptF/LptG family permease [Flavobacteriaceae bacterium]|nr:LptF/LptG family permease [Flavobacteriaceae bacterium]